MREQGGGTVQVKATFSAFGDRQALQDLDLQRGAEALGLLDAVVLGSGLQFRERRDAEILVEPQHLLRTQTGYGQQLKHASWYFLPELFEARMTARLVEFGDDVGDRSANPGDLSQPVVGDEHVQRNRESRQAVGGSRIGLSPVGIAAAQGGALRILSQEICHTASVERRHSASLPVRVLRPSRSKATAGTVAWPAFERLSSF